MSGLRRRWRCAVGVVDIAFDVRPTDQDRVLLVVVTAESDVFVALLNVAGSGEAHQGVDARARRVPVEDLGHFVLVDADLVSSALIEAMSRAVDGHDASAAAVGSAVVSSSCGRRRGCRGGITRDHPRWMRLLQTSRQNL